MKRWLLLPVLALASIAAPLRAQTYHDSGGAIVPGVVIVDPTGLTGALGTAANPMHVSGTFAATLSGFQPTPSYSQLSVFSSVSNRVALPNGNTIIVYNIGANDAYVTLGSSNVAATAADDVIKAGGWMAFAVGSNGYLAAITASGTTGLNISGGIGLPTGTAGANSSGGGGGGGTVAQGNAGSAGSAWYVQPGTGAVFPVSAGNLPLPVGAATSALQSSVLTALGAPFQAGGAISNSAFGISGTLPPFASTPTFNLGALNGAATAANQPALNGDGGALAHVTNFPTTQAVSAVSLPLPAGAATAALQSSIVTALGSPFQTGGSVGNTSFGATVTQWGGTALGAASAWGTAPSGNVNGVNADILAEPGTGSTGSAVPSTAQFAGAESSGNLVGVIQADNSAAISISTATTTQLIALSASKKIYVTAWDVIAAGTGAITLEYGTGTNCGTGTTALTGSYILIAQTGISKGGGLGPVLVVPAGNALCALTSAAVQMSGSVAYTQF